uniref:Uncharacterized protein n=1 Tax=Ascaris lumbricoides TaxID=6252 RepID=A0A9J2Q393_ASCLU
MPSAKLVATNPSCKCYCTGGKRVSYPYGWATAASHHPSSSVVDSSQLIPDRPAIKPDEEGRQESIYPAAVRQLEHLNLERKTSVPAQVLSALTGSSTAAAHAPGCKKVGKTACLQQLACVNDITSQPYEPTIDDTYQVQMDYGDRPKEIMVFHDTAGLSEYGPVELRRPYIQAMVDHETFNRMDLLKKFIDKQFGKDKKEVPIVVLGNMIDLPGRKVPIVVLGNMIDLPGRKVDSEFAQSWASREKVKLYEVTATDRNTLVELVIYLGSRHFHSQRMLIPSCYLLFFSFLTLFSQAFCSSLMHIVS